MLNLIVTDDVITFTKKYNKITKSYLNPPKHMGYSKDGLRLYKKYCVISDGNPLADFMLAGLCSLSLENTAEIFALTIGSSEFKKLPDVNYESVTFKTLAELSNFSDCAFILCVDCEKIDAKTDVLDFIAKIAAIAKSGKNNKLLVSALLPAYPAISGGIESLAEREFSYYIETLDKKTAGIEYYIELEKCCRRTAGEIFPNIIVSRIDNLYGPGSNMLRFFDVEAYVVEAFEKGKVTIKTSDYKNVFTVAYVLDAALFNIKLLYTGKVGNIYNFASSRATIAEIKNNIRENFSGELALNVNSAGYEPEYACLNTLKFYQCQWKRGSNTSLANGMYKTVCYERDVLPRNKSVEVYSGKLGRIQSLEVMILRDIDKICREHDIKYFICGGSMLGAKRYGHSIPWDDDLDIGMLREDFDKFRKVCETELPDRYTYSCHYNESGSHYIVDKIRLNGTYFSTRYSSIHEYNDGIFVDILVYDASANDYKIADLHGKALSLMSRAIISRWYGHPIKGKGLRRQQLLLPVMNKIPMELYNKAYEKGLTLFKNNKNPVWFIDGVGKKQADGPCLIEGLDDLEYVQFDEGFMAPIPKDCTNYLTYAYGPDYINEPRLSSRSAPHNFARIDLGEYLFESKPKEEFRKVDVRGELYEKENED